MKWTLASQLRYTVLALALLAVLSLTGCWKPVGFFQQSPSPAPPPVAPGPVKPAGAANLQQQAVDTVTTYLRALSQDGGHVPDYDTAYAMLSRTSRAKHTRAQFETIGRQGIPNFDLKTAYAKVKNETAIVELSNPDEDSKAHAFHLLREDGQWKVVYLGGAPGMPFAE